MKEDRKALVLDNRRIGIQMELMMGQAMAEKGLSAAQGHILLFILKYSRQGTSLTEIHQEFGYSMASLSSILKRLRKHGYVRVEPCLEDNRRKVLYPTEQAEQLKEFLICALANTCDRAYQGFSQAELIQLDRLQKKLMRNLLVETDPQAETRRSEDCEESAKSVKAV